MRSLFTAGALAVIRYAKIHGTGHRPWLTGLSARRPSATRNPPLLRRELDHSRSSGCHITVGRDEQH
ncbi:hypothetical protein CWO91_25280 [Bradyrhizobium genosp. SA-3]|nr:hypothetical protein CWO91_25280 [Bradyrhizobium genosp. SA-3]